MRSFSTAVLSVYHPSLASAFDSLFNDIYYLSLLGAQNQTFPNVIFEMASNAHLLPFTIPNVFQNIVDDPSCSPPDHMAAVGDDCNFLTNYGQDTEMILMTLGGCLLFMGIGYLMRLLMEKKPLIGQNRGVQTAYRTCMALGMRYFLLKMDGNVLEIVIYSINGLTTMRSGEYIKGANIGAVASIFFLAYYLVYTFLVYLWCRSAVQCVRDRLHITNNPEAKEMQEAITLHRVSFSWMEYLLEGYKYPINPIHLHMPVWSLVRVWTEAIIVVNMGEHRLAMLIVLACVEIAFYFYYLRSKVWANKVDRTVEGTTHFVRAAYTVGAMLTLTEAGERDPDGFVGIILALLLITSAVVTLGAMLIVIGQVIVSIIKAFLCKPKNPTGTNSTPSKLFHLKKKSTNGTIAAAHASTFPSTPIPTEEKELGEDDKDEAEVGSSPYFMQSGRAMSPARMLTYTEEIEQEQPQEQPTPAE